MISPPISTREWKITVGLFEKGMSMTYRRVRRCRCSVVTLSVAFLEPRRAGFQQRCRPGGTVTTNPFACTHRATVPQRDRSVTGEAPSPTVTA